MLQHSLWNNKINRIWRTRLSKICIYFKKSPRFLWMSYNYHVTWWYIGVTSHHVLFCRLFVTRKIKASESRFDSSIFLTLSWRKSLSYRNQSLICSVNQWTSFYMIRTSIISKWMLARKTYVNPFLSQYSLLSPLKTSEKL